MWLESIEMYRPAIAWWVIAAALAAAGIAAAALYVHAARDGARARAAALAALRVTALAALAWVLAGPSVMRDADVHTARPTVALLVDTSRSMNERDVLPPRNVQPANPQPVTRWDALADTWLDDAFLSALRDRAAMRMYRFDESLQPLDVDAVAHLTPDGDATNLFDAIDQVTRDARPDVAVVLSDGRDTRYVGHDRLIDALPERGTTLFAVPVGTARQAPHLALHAWPDADVLYEGQSTTIHASVVHHARAGERARATLRLDGEPIDTKVLTFTDRPVERVSFNVTPPGPGPRSTAIHDYELRVEPIDGADDAPHPRQRVFIQTSRERIRVALFEGQPYWDTRFLTRVLQRDPRIEFTAVYAFGDARRLHVADDDAVPIDPDAIDQGTLDRFDVVILGKRAERFFGGAGGALLRAFVERRGGALVLARGRPFDVSDPSGRQAMAALEPIAPVAWGRDTVRELQLAVTPEGVRTGLIEDELVTELPRMIAATRVEGTRGASVVLLRQAATSDAPPSQERDMAALVHGRFGRGQVLAVLTDGLHRWAMQSASDTARGAYETFWRRAMRWLAADGEFLPGQDVSLSLERTIVEPGETVTVTAATRQPEPDLEPAVALIGPDGERRKIDLHREPESTTRWRGTAHPTDEGVHRLELVALGHPQLVDPDAPPTVLLAARSRSTETLDTAARPDTLDTLAQATGGATLGLAERDWLLEHLDAVARARTDDAVPEYAFARWPALLIIVGCLGIEWFVRRRSGWL